MKAEKIRILRILKGYSQEYVSFQLDISQSAYSKIESGKHSISVRRLLKIAEILGVSASELLLDLDEV